MDAAEDGFGDTQGGITPFVQALGRNDLDDSRFIFKNTPDDIDAQAPDLGGLLDGVMLLKGRAGRQRNG